VTFRELASALIAAAPLVGLADSDRVAVEGALAARGLAGGLSLAADWAGVGSGTAATPGLLVIDQPAKLRDWADRVGAGTSGVAEITQGSDTGLNGRLDPGEVALVWFDVRNLGSLTAGGLAITISSDDDDVTVLDERFNWGYDPATGATQIRYGKVNGSAIVAALSSSNPIYHVPTGPTYFQTNPFFDEGPVTGVWVKAASGAAHGKVVNLRARILPANGPLATVLFPVTLR
jgi:hypothetical protein